MATDFGFQSGVSAFQTTVDEPARQEQVRAKTDLLSSQAEAQKMVVETAKEQARIKLLTQSTYRRIQLENANIKATDTAGQITLYKKAMEADGIPVEVQENFRTKIAELSKTQTEEAESTLKIKEKQNEADTIAVDQALFNPSTGGQNLILSGQSSGNQEIVGLGRVLSNQVPVPPHLVGGREVFYSGLTPEERNAVNLEIRKNFSGKKGETAERNIFNEMIQTARLEEQIQKRKQEAKEEEAKLAHARDKLKSEEKEKQEKAETKAKEKSLARDKLILDYIEELDKLEKNNPEVKNPAYAKEVEDSIFGSTFAKAPEFIPNPRIKQLEEGIAKLKGAKEKELTGEPNPDVSTYTPTQEAWIAAAMKANPDLTKEEVVAQGKKLKKL